MLIRKYPSVLIFLAVLAIFTVAVTLMSQAYGTGAIPTATVKTLGKTLCLALAALAMDLVWGYAGILSLGHMAFFALGGYMIGMWLMYARTEEIVVQALASGPIPATAEEVAQGVVWPLLGAESDTDDPSPLETIRATLREAGVLEIRTWPDLNEPEFCEDCGVPLYPNVKGDIVHADMPEDVEPEATHFH